MSAIIASKFPEFLSTYNTAFSEVFAAVKDIRCHATALSDQYSKLFYQLVSLDVLNKEYMQDEEDYNVLNVSQGVSKFIPYFSTLGESMYDCLRRKLTYSADLGKVSYHDLWETR